MRQPAPAISEWQSECKRRLRGLRMACFCFSACVTMDPSLRFSWKAGSAKPCNKSRLGAHIYGYLLQSNVDAGAGRGAEERAPAKSKASVARGPPPSPASMHNTSHTAEATQTLPSSGLRAAGMSGLAAVELAWHSI